MTTAAALLERPAVIDADHDDRKPAHWEYLERKFIATGRRGERWRVIEHCRAELAWRMARSGNINHDTRDGLQWFEIHRTPLEFAAVKVVSCWDHLHPTEHSIRKITNRGNGVLRAQRKAACADRYSEAQRYDWGRRAEATLDDLRWFLADRRKQVKAFNAAVAEYRALRRAIDPSKP